MFYAALLNHRVFAVGAIVLKDPVIFSAVMPANDEFSIQSMKVWTRRLEFYLRFP